MTKKILLLLASITIAGLSACASKPLTQDQMNQYPNLVGLEKKLDNAKEKDVHLLAPAHYQQALTKYLEAYAAVQSGYSQEEVSQTVASGMRSLNKALELEDNSRKLLSEVLVTRSRAIQAGADRYYSQAFNELDEKLVDTAALVESNAVEKAKKRRPGLQASYLDFELAAIKHKTIAGAQTAIQKAKSNDAEKYAPKTLNTAVEELTLAQQVLDSDRTGKDKADAHAKRAADHANRAYYIAETVKDIKRRDLSQEEVILTYQNQLAELGQLINQNLVFGKSDADTVSDLHLGFVKLIDTNNLNASKASDLKAKLASMESQSEKNIAQLKKQHADELTKLRAKYTGEITVLGKTQRNLEILQQEQQERFARIQAAFNEDEANVFRQKNNVLISVHGFKFPVGSAEIRPENFALMNKITKVIDEFKSSKIIVSGHTDAAGKLETNQTLSTERAENVAKFLTEVAKIPSSRIRSKGYGPEKPVASNTTASGRALNRRVEILIVNE